MPSSASPPLSIARQLQVSFRRISITIAVALSIAAVALTASLAIVDPRRSRAIDADNADHDAHRVGAAPSTLFSLCAGLSPCVRRQP